MPKGIVSLIGQEKLDSGDDSCESCDWCEGSTGGGDHCQYEGEDD